MGLLCTGKWPLSQEFQAMPDSPTYHGKVYRAPSGQWSWKVYCDTEEIGGGAGCSSPEEAQEGCDEALALYSRDVADLSEVTRTHCAALQRVAHEPFIPHLLACSIREIMARFTVDTERRLEALARHRQALGAEFASSSGSDQSITQLEEWLSLVIPPLVELGDAGLRNVNQLRGSIQEIYHLLEEDLERYRVPLLALDLAFDQVGQLAALAGTHYDAWSELHQSIQAQIQSQLKHWPGGDFRPPGGEEEKMPFKEVLSRLDDGMRLVLAKVANARPDGIAVRDLQHWLREDHQNQSMLGQVEESLRKLADLQLVHQGGDNWHVTWEGQGVANWWQQTTWSDDSPPEPRPGENGNVPAPAPCDEYRALFSVPGYCWCGHFRTEHLSEVVRVAEKIIGEQRR
jgi:hypothetical protein